MTSKIKKYLSISLAAVMLSTLTVGQALAFANDLKEKEGVISSTPSNGVSFAEATGRADLSNVVIENFNSQVVQNYANEVENTVQTVIVKLKQESLLDLSNNLSIASYLSTSQGRRSQYNIERAQSDFLTKLTVSGIDYQLVDTYSTIMAGVTLEVDTTKIAEIKAMPNVESVVVSDFYAYPETAAAETTSGSTSAQADGSAVTNPNNVYATGIYDSSEYVEKGIDGSGMTVAVLDTGLDYTHDAFTTYMPPQETVGMTKDYVSQRLNLNLAASRLSAARNQTLTADDVYVNAKVPFAYDYSDSDADVYPAYNPHGTHVAGIVAGHADSYSDNDGNVPMQDDGETPVAFYGVAPNAQLVICKVFTDDFDSVDLGGATTESLLAALEDCVKLDVDVINMSLGTVAGFSSIYIEGDSEGGLLNDIYEQISGAGISLVCAASNEYSSGYGSVFGTNLASNPDSGTVGSPSTYTGALSVASINGQTSPFLMANETSPIFFENASDQNSVQFDFIKQMLADKTSDTFKYVVVPGTGRAADYTQTIRDRLVDKEEGEKVIAVVSRGNNTFQDKVDIAKRMGADAIIIYNNVAGTVRMSVGDLVDPIPAISVNLDAGRALIFDSNGAAISIGEIELNTTYQAGPFMNDYSSWGVTSDLKLKPEITAHGGEITSTVSGGYDEMSGTSMATPNLAGFIALLRSQLKSTTLNGKALNDMINQIVMSTAQMVYDQQGLPYSPRKQGSGLAMLDNVMNTKAYLLTDEDEGCETRPKAELGSDTEKTGEYEIKFSVKNSSTDELNFRAEAIFMTETLSSDGLSVAEQAHLFDDVPATWTVGGAPVSEGTTFAVRAGETVEIVVNLKLSDAEKQYIDSTFVNGMFVEGFLRLLSATEGQCDLTLPFMGFYGDWTKAPMLDYDAYEVAAFEQDASYTDETRPQARVWATQAYSQYNNGQYYVPIGSYMYVQDESADQIYATMEHNVISQYNDYYGYNNAANYVTTTGIYTLYAGLLRNAEIVTFDLTNVNTGEVVESGRDYRIGKAYASSGGMPGRVITELFSSQLGLLNNGKYELKFNFYFDADDQKAGNAAAEEDTFTMTFYVDYEAPVLQNSSIRYYDYQDGNTTKQNIFLDLDIYDNTYAQSVMLCRVVTQNDSSRAIELATEYVTPVRDANFNDTTRVSIDITDIVTFVNGVPNFPDDPMYLRIDDYGLNFSLWTVDFSNANTQSTPDTFTVSNGTDLELDIYQSHTVQLSYTGSYNLSNFSWGTTDPAVAVVKNGEIVGMGAGDAMITVSNGTTTQFINVEVSSTERDIQLQGISFASMFDYNNAVVAASGTVEVNAATDFKLEIVPTPWYYPTDRITVRWEVENTGTIVAATVDQSGNVSTQMVERGGSCIVRAIYTNGGADTLYRTSVTLRVRDPFTISNYTLTDYHGNSGTVVIPSDRNLMYIGEEAFQDDETIVKVIIPKTVSQINRRAFQNCINLEEVYFIQEEALAVPDASLTLILSYAFDGCTSLKKIDFTNCKTFTVDQYAFNNCRALTTIEAMTRIGAMYTGSFNNCVSLTTLDLTGLHKAEDGVFQDCTGINSVTTGYYTVLGERMFQGCTSLTSITLNMPIIPSLAFVGCTALETVNFAGAEVEYFINSQAFEDCTELNQVIFNQTCTVARIGDEAFVDCDKLASITLPAGTVLGSSVFNNATAVTITGFDAVDGAIYDGTTLVLAPKVIPANFSIRAGTTAIAQFAFSGTTLGEQASSILEIPDTVLTIGEGVFANSEFTEVRLGTGVTSIPANTFNNSKITTVTIGNKITEIGDYAFAGTTKLLNISFETTSTLTSIGEYAFAGTALTDITLPSSVRSLGAYAFTESAIETADLGSIETMGEWAFFNAVNLQTVTTGNSLRVIPAYAFAVFDYYGRYESSLTTVNIGTSVIGIGSYAFMNCLSLSSIDLGNTRILSEGAFYMDPALADSALKTVTGLENLQIIGDGAFYNNYITSNLTLTRATSIGAFAFYSLADSNDTLYQTLTFPAAVTIGQFAFFGNHAQSIAIPASVTSIGDAAFANSWISNVSTSGNTQFFVDLGVLYRTMYDASNNETGYELVYYPSNRHANEVNGIKTYTVIDKTIQVQGYAMAYLGDTRVAAVVLPYSIKTLGDAAFYDSGITTYTFNSINAPALLTDVHIPSNSEAPRTYFYMTFQDSYYNHIAATTTETLSIAYPTNGVGYTNFVFETYFSTRTQLGVLMNDETRSAKTAIEGFETPEVVATWNTLEVTTENTAIVNAFSEQVKEAHRIYNTIRNDANQVGFLGAENVDKLFAIEAQLVSVKARFGITVTPTALTVSSASTHKSSYLEGETFDMTGLVLLVTYDDYSTGTADLSRCTLVTTTALTTLNRYVTITGYGRTVRVEITVTATDSGETGGEPTEQPQDEDNNMIIIICCSVAGGVLVLGAAAAVTIILLKRRKNNESKD